MTATGVWTENEVATNFYYVRGSLTNTGGDTVLATREVKWWQKITNPCLRSSSITAQTINDLDYWIKDPAVSTTFTNFADWASTTYSSQGSNLCGAKSYQIFADDQFTPYPVAKHPTITSYLSYSVSSSTHTLSVSTSDVSLVNNDYKTFYVRVILNNYYAVYP